MRYPIVFLFIFLAACSVRKVPVDEASFILNSSDVYDYCARMNLRDTNANLIIIRDEGFWGSENPHIILLDGAPCADLMPGEKLSLFLPIGDYTVEVKKKWSKQTNYNKVVTDVDLSNSKTTVVHDGVDAYGIQYINQSSE